MLNVFKPFLWSVNWIKRRQTELAQRPCALSTCSKPQSRWQRLQDRRRPTGTFLQGDFYCRPQCLETALVAQLSRLRTMPPTFPPPNRIPLGLLMVARGKLSHLEVRAALEAQRRARHGKIGEWIEKLGFATEQEVTTALALQWGCPVATTFDPAALPSLDSIPMPIMEAFQMLPLNFVTSSATLFIAFGERVDHAALYAIEKILNCRTQPCVAGRKSVARQLDAMRQVPRPSDVEFGPMYDLSEMSRIAASYTARLSPEHVRLNRIGRFIWLRMEVSRDGRFDADARPISRAITTNLVFRLPTEAARGGALHKNETSSNVRF
jgi:Type II secretion system (T2SS), protein E, N-terminal domain